MALKLAPHPGSTVSVDTWPGRRWRVKSIDDGQAHLIALDQFDRSELRGIALSRIERVA